MACEADKMDGFKHSVIVPQNYKHVAKIIQKVQEGGLGIKYSVYGDKDNFDYDKNKQRNLALTYRILSKSQIIEHILRKTQLLIKEPRLDPWLARVLIYELVWRKDLEHESKPIQTINKYKKEIREASENYEGDFKPLQPTERVIKPRYIRINTFKMSTAEVIATLRYDGLIFMPSVQETYSEYLEAVANLNNYQFMIDFHIKDMLVFGPAFPFIKHEFYRNSVFILQDKASCLAPLLLDPPEGGVVLDMCAAPGMKTNYLANLVGAKGRVYAVEKHHQRYLTLCKMMHAHGLKNVHCMKRDATSITGDELADVEYILVDPSCSGSGMVNRIDFEGSKPDRLESLSNFQIAILRHALTKFPNVKRVAYSTCSIHPAENEVVVTAVLNQVKDFKLVNLQEKLKPNWNNFGLEEYEYGPSCLYSNTEHDYTNGFFLAIFERIANTNHTSKRKYKEKQNINQNEQENYTHHTESFSKTKKLKNNNEFMGESNNIQETVEENYVKEKKKKKIKEEIVANVEESTLEEKPKKKEKKIKDEIIYEGEFTSEEKKSKKKVQDEIVDIVEEPILKEKTKKKKSAKTGNMEETIVEAEEKIMKKKKQVDETLNLEDNVEQKKKTKKRKKTDETVEEKKKMNEQVVEESAVEENNAEEKKKKTVKTVEEPENVDESIGNGSVKDKKKKKKKKNQTFAETETLEISAVGENNVEEKKKKRKKTSESVIEDTSNIEEMDSHTEKKKKKKTNKEINEIENMVEASETVIEIKSKKKKSKKIIESIEDENGIEENQEKSEEHYLEELKKQQWMNKMYKKIAKMQTCEADED